VGHFKKDDHLAAILHRRHNELGRIERAKMRTKETTAFTLEDLFLLIPQGEKCRVSVEWRGKKESAWKRRRELCSKWTLKKRADRRQSPTHTSLIADR